MSSSSRKPSAPTLQELRASRGDVPSFARRFRRWLIAAGVLIFLILFGFFGLPPIVKAQAIKQLSTRLGREVRIETLRINPLVLSTTIEGFAVREADPAGGDFTGWKRLYVNFDSFSLFLGELRFQEIVLEGFHAHVARGPGGAQNFDDIVKRVQADRAAAPKQPAEPDAKPTPVVIARLSVVEARVAFDDASRQRPYATQVGPVTFNLQDFRTVGEAGSRAYFEAVTGRGERFVWRGGVSVSPLKSAGEIEIANIDLAHLSPYHHHLVSGELRSAFADFTGRYTFELKDGKPHATLADGAFTLRDLRFGTPGAEADALALRRLAVTGISAAAADATNPASATAAINRVAVEGVRVRVTRDGPGAAGVDLVRLVAPVPSAPPAPVAASPSGTAPASTPPAAALPKLTLGELSVSDVKLEAVDLTTPRRAEHRVEDLSLVVRDLDSANLAKNLPLSLELTLPDEGRVAVLGTVAAQPLVAELDVQLERVPFANASPYIEPFLNIRLVGGTLRTQGKASLRDAAITFTGDVGVEGFRTVDGKLAEDFVKWSDFALTGIKATTAPLAFHADEIRFVEPVAAVRVDEDGSLNIAKAAASPVPSASVTAPAPANSPASAAPPAAGGEGGATAGADAARSPLPLAITIGRFAFDRAAFRFEDRSVKPAARGGIVDFSGAITGLSSEALGRADVDLRGKVDGIAPVAITGKLNPLGSPAFVDLSVDFRGIDLQPGAGPYIGKFAGRQLTRGNLNVAVKARLDDRKLDTANVVTLDQFHLGAPTNSPDATKLPVGLALALLRDTEGKIVIDLPVKGSLDDPNFKIGRVVVRVLVNILTKAATSPFSLLGAAFGGGGDELGWQEFGPGMTAPDAAGIKKLETVAKALGGRPALKLDIAGAYDAAQDLAALRLERLDRQVRAAIWEERRLADPNTPAPEALVITEDQRTAAITRLFAVAFPEAAATASLGASASPASGSAPGEPENALSSAKTADDRVDESKRADNSRARIGRLPRYNGIPRVLADKTIVEDAPRSKPTAARAPEAASQPPPTAEGVGSPATVIPLAEMEIRLARGIAIADSELQALAEARAQAIRNWLIETGKVSPERIFLTPVAATGTRVNLNLK